MELPQETQQRVQRIMDFRQGIVAELANPYLDHGQIKKLIREKTAQQYEMPWSSKTTIGQGSIQNCLKRIGNAVRKDCVQKEEPTAGKAGR